MLQGLGVAAYRQRSEWRVGAGCGFMRANDLT